MAPPSSSEVQQIPVGVLHIESSSQAGWFDGSIWNTESVEAEAGAQGNFIGLYIGVMLSSRVFYAVMSDQEDKIRGARSRSP